MSDNLDVGAIVAELNDCGFEDAIRLIDYLTIERNRAQKQLTELRDPAQSLPAPLLERAVDQLRRRAAVYGGCATSIYSGRVVADELKEGARRIEAMADNASPWQPIETAPKDGTIILVAGTGSEGWFVADSKWDGEWCLFDPHTDDHTEPMFGISHWMPVPAFPSTERDAIKAMHSTGRTKAGNDISGI